MAEFDPIPTTEKIERLVIEKLAAMNFRRVRVKLSIVEHTKHVAIENGGIRGCAFQSRHAALQFLRHPFIIAALNRDEIPARRANAVIAGRGRAAMRLRDEAELIVPHIIIDYLGRRVG